jgi:hypothetical protein
MYVLIASLSLAATPAASAQPTAVRTLIGGEDERVSPLLNPRQVALVDGRLLVLESAEPFLSLYAPDGRLVQRTVRAGGGPSEMRSGAAFTYAPGTRELWVFDSPNSRALVFTLSDTLTFRRSVRMPAHVVSGCFLGGQLWVSANVGGLAVHRLEERDGAARIVASAGRLRIAHPSADHPILKSFAAQGFVACDDRTRSVTMVSRSLGQAVTVAVPDMTERTAAVASFRPVVFEIVGAMALEQRFPDDGGYDQVVDVRIETTSGVVVTLGEANHDHPGGGDYMRYREVRLEARDPTGTVSRWLQLGRVGSRSFCD